jgi:hypothetical protein
VVQKEVYGVAYPKIVKMIPVEKRGIISEKLLNYVLKSKKESKLPSSMAKCFLSQWETGKFDDDVGLGVLLETAAVLELEKTAEFLEQECQLAEVAKAIKEA